LRVNQETVCVMTGSILIKNGYVFDGAGNPWFKADILVEQDKIVKMSRTVTDDAERVINAQGLCVSPGFIDVHSHADIARGILEEPLANSLVMQGITTFLGGNCGMSAAPGPGKTSGSNTDAPGRAALPNFERYFHAIEEKGAAVNVATLVGHGTVRDYVMGFEARAPTSRELEEMKSLVAASMREGVFGLSAGLAYPPGFYADTNEIIEMCKVASAYDGIYTSHIRGQGKTDFLPAIEEAIRIGEEAGVPVIISHVETHYDAWGLENEAIRRIDAARERGVDVTCDVCTMVMGGMGLVNILPKWVLEGGFEKAKKVLKDPGTHRKIRDDVNKASGNVARCIARDGRWEMFLILDSRKYPESIGKTFADLAKSKGRDPWEMLFDVIIEDDMKVRSTAHNEDDMRTALKHPACAIQTDEGILKQQDDPSKVKWEAHPRAGITFPMIFRKYVRGETRTDLPYDEGTRLLTMEEAVRKMTGMSARMMGLKDRGLLREGFFADFVIFDKDRIGDTATYEYPYLYPKGIEYAIVNGTVVVDSGHHTGALPGRVLKKEAMAPLD
jgi:N-acyl-D-amino-acid deacylase